jgi:hypothetical protein
MGAAATLARRETELANRAMGRPSTSHGVALAGVGHRFQSALGTRACGGASAATLFERSRWKTAAITARPNECLSC